MTMPSALARSSHFLAAASALAVSALALSTCAPDNPPQLWLSSNGDELHVKLVPVQPDPF